MRYPNGDARVDTDCPHCDTPSTAAAGVRGGELKIPEPGDVTMCVYCGGVSQFDGAMNLIPVPPDDEIMRDPRLGALLEAYTVMSDQRNYE